MATVVVGAAIVRDGALLAAQRSYPHSLAGFWELPGGQVEPGEREDDALRRECREELGVDVRIGRRVGGDADLPGGAVLRIYAATLTDPAAEPVALEHRALRWVGGGALDDVEWLPGDQALLPELHALLATAEPEATAHRQDHRRPGG